MRIGTCDSFGLLAVRKERCYMMATIYGDFASTKTIASVLETVTAMEYISRSCAEDSHVANYRNFISGVICDIE
jgi:hypothetical protein